MTDHDAALSEAAILLRRGQSVSLLNPSEQHNQEWAVTLATRLQSSPESVLVVRIDCHALASADSDRIFEVCRHAVYDAAGEADVTPAPGRPARLAFEAALRQVGRRYAHMVMMLIGLEHLAANSRIDVALFNALRSITARLSLAILTISQRPLIELTYAGDPAAIRSSPFFNIFVQIDLP